MRSEEAETLAAWILGLKLKPGAVCLNIGSSTKRFREVDQPHIYEQFIAPLEASGIRFIHCDMKEAEGVDEVGDVLDPDFRSRLQGYRADVLVCSNLLEHLTKPKEFARACGELVRDGGYGLFSVPLSYPYHPDPIDTMFRPRPEDLAAMLPGWRPIEARVLEVGTYWEDLRKSGKPVQGLVRRLARAALPFYRPKKWRTNASRLAWLFRPYRLSLVLLSKPCNADSGREAASGNRT